MMSNYFTVMMTFAFTNDLTLATHNIREFDRIEGLMQMFWRGRFGSGWMMLPQKILAKPAPPILKTIASEDSLRSH
jgi:hypothetical protein